MIGIEDKLADLPGQSDDLITEGALAVSVEYDFVQPVRTFRRVLHELRELWPDPFGKATPAAELPIAP